MSVSEFSEYVSYCDWLMSRDVFNYRFKTWRFYA